MFKKFVCLASAALLFAQFANAQSKKGDFEINLSYGALSAPRLYNELGDILTMVGTFGTYYETNKSTYGPVALTGSYAVTDRLKVGAAFSYERDKSEYWSQAFNGNHDKMEGDFNIDSYGIMTSGSFSYLNKQYVQLYSGVALGLGIRKSEFKKTPESGIANETNTSARFAYQLTGFGVRVGGKLAAFAEVGFGYKGMILTGISYRF